MMAYINPIEVRIACEDAPSAVDPHRSVRRGMAITWKNGGNSNSYVYATFVAPASFTNGRIRGAFKNWTTNPDTTFTTRAFVDVLSDGDSIPEDTTGQSKSHTGVDNLVRFRDIATGIAANAGEQILVAFRVDGGSIATGNELVLHSLWLEY